MEYGEITRQVSRETGLPLLAAAAVVELTGKLVGEAIMRHLYDPEWPTDRQYEAVEAAAHIARDAATYVDDGERPPEL